MERRGQSCKMLNLVCAAHVDDSPIQRRQIQSLLAEEQDKARELHQAEPSSRAARLGVLGLVMPELTAVGVAINLSHVGGNLGNLAPAPRIFNVTNEVADDFNLISVVTDFNVSELIFDQYQQFQTIKPTGPEVVTEVCFVRDAIYVDIEKLGHKCANFANFRALVS